MLRSSAEDLWLACVALVDRPSRVRAEHLTPRGRRILETIEALRSEGWAVVPGELLVQRLAGDAGTVPARIDQIDAESVMPQAERLVLESWSRARYADALRHASALVAEEGREAADTHVAQVLAEIDESAAQREWLTLAQAAEEHADQAKRILSGESAAQVFSGYREIDTAVRWWRSRFCTIIAGFTGHGKSTLTAQILAGIAHRGVPAALISNEDATSIPVGRLYKLAAYNPNSADRIAILNRVTAADISEFGIWIANNREVPLHLMHAGGATVPRIRALMAEAKRRFGTRVIAVDYLQAIRFGAGSRADQIGEAIVELKSEAARQDLHLIVCSQLRRPAETSKPGRPTLYMLKNSGDIENAADYIMIVHRPDIGQEIDKEEASVYVDKAKDGGRREIKLWWDGTRHAYTLSSDGDAHGSMV